jgi:hypothetical protein
MRIGISSSVMASKRVNRTANANGATVAEMGMEHRGLDVLVA